MGKIWPFDMVSLYNTSLTLNNTLNPAVDNNRIQRPSDFLPNPWHHDGMGLVPRLQHRVQAAAGSNTQRNYLFIGTNRSKMPDADA
jgi:hypothetical protein